MLQPQPLQRKMYSRSNMLIPIKPVNLSGANNGLGSSRAEGIRGKIEISLRDKFKGSVGKLQKEKKCEKFIDNILREHVKEENIPVMINHFTKKTSFKNYRIVKTQQLETSPELQSQQSHRLISYNSERQKEFIDRYRNEQRWKSSQKKVELPLIFKFKRTEAEQEQESSRDKNQGSRELKLKELKQKTLLKHIGSTKQS